MATYERTGTFRLVVKHEGVHAMDLLATVPAVAGRALGSGGGELPVTNQDGVFQCVADGG